MFQGPCCDKNRDCVCDSYCGPGCYDGAIPIPHPAQCTQRNPYLCRSQSDVNQRDCPSCQAHMFQGPCCDANPDCVCDSYCGPGCNDGAIAIEELSSPPSPPPLLPPSLPPPDTLPLILGSAAGVTAVLLSLCLLAVLVCKKNIRSAFVRHRAPTNSVPHGISMGDAPISTGTVRGPTDSLASARIVPSGAVVGELVAPAAGGAWGAKFDAHTGQPIPKFDPMTGKQNWAEARPPSCSSDVKA